MKKLNLKDKIRGLYFIMSLAVCASIAEADLLIVFALVANFGVAVWQANKIKINEKETV